MLSSWLKIYVFVTKAATIAHVNFQARAMEMIQTVTVLLLSRSKDTRV